MTSIQIIDSSRTFQVTYIHIFLKRFKIPVGKQKEPNERALSSIMAGVRIGENAVVGASAVVTGDVPANTVVIGAPARPYMTRKEYDQKRLRWEEAG